MPKFNTLEEQEKHDEKVVQEELKQKETEDKANKIITNIEPIKDKDNYTIVPSPITNQQIETIFSRTPKEHIYERPAKGGGKWQYVTGVYVKKILTKYKF